ncbi:MAG: penicillin-binding transpeptidase domain-containing protein, partial [Oscillospiraceae bacterium]|nr:penicillin-binding transpeptidase domain-containing protein [Oscillospiraceae bacterium]
DGTIPGVRDWPRNYDRTYGPPVTVAAGIARSLNTTAVWTIHMITPDFAFDYMKSFLGMESLNDPYDKTYSLTLGGLYEGVTPLEMCAAYAAFGNGGYYYTPHSYLYVLDAQGDVVFDKTAYVQKIKAFGDDTAYIMNRLLYNVMHSGFSGTGVSACPSDHLDYVGKSGTHTDNMDYWFIGMNPYYVMSVWQGYEPQFAMESPRPHPVQLVFRKVMTQISADLEPLDFPVPESGVRAARFCMASGNLASGECTDTRTGYYKDDYMPSVCNHANAPDPNDPIYSLPLSERPPPG